METVLVVDDEPTIRDVVVQYLRREGFATLEAGDGDAARELLEREWPSLVVLDLMLPGTDGLALCRWIRDRSQLPAVGRGGVLDLAWDGEGDVILSGPVAEVFRGTWPD